MICLRHFRSARQNTSDALSCRLLDINITPSPYSPVPLLLARPSLFSLFFDTLCCIRLCIFLWAEAPVTPSSITFGSISRRQHSNRAVVTLPHLFLYPKE
ncbi:hypothetical protein LMH87_012107 [Akanthomyces muscarius]|uniref:Uncharacterized protein n=1 Tax=Akanthomyces muscarius TaxID=2231603 RepID=A0A9W8QB19_AKAMU|nr:hypothetical protein LMH87_012107 [Akanthomyces muscarius]KAJ4151405.1 hypothetical protein LMH87_012107 [Akanthomyces muscarius]